LKPCPSRRGAAGRSIVITGGRRGPTAVHPSFRLGEIEIRHPQPRRPGGDRSSPLGHRAGACLPASPARRRRVVVREEILDAIWAPTSWPRATSWTATSGAAHQLQNDYRHPLHRTVPGRATLIPTFQQPAGTAGRAAASVPARPASVPARTEVVERRGTGIATATLHQLPVTRRSVSLRDVGAPAVSAHRHYGPYDWVEWTPDTGP